MSWEALPKRAKRNERNKVYAEIDRNIEQRHQEEKNVGSLIDLDGAKGDFYEYLDHTADVQLHAWGNNMQHAFSNLGRCMFNYMTDISKIDISSRAIKISVEGHDMESLVFNYLDELLYQFHTENFCCKDIHIDQFNQELYRVEASLYGEIFDRMKHNQGTEIKAITYSNMQIHTTNENQCDIYVIVDI